MGRILLFTSALLLTATAVIHALGQPMVDEWVQGLSETQKAAICLVWVTDSISWMVVAVLWAMAGWKQRAWLGAGVIAAAIPAITAVGILAIDPTFFGGWLLVASLLLAAAGSILIWRDQQQP